MDPAEALADLTEISTQIESALVATPTGEPVASTLPDDASRALAEHAVRLLDGASDGGAGEEPTHLRVATREGCLFVVRGETLVATAVTGAQPTTGLVFYDLKTCLRTIVEAEPAKKPKRRAPAKKAAADA